MPRLSLRQRTSVAELREIAPAWDRLWERSEVSLLTVRAELTAQWVERFAPRAKLRILIVEDGGELVAALPLAGRRIGRLLPVGDLTSNYWSPNGELLLDPSADSDAALGLLIKELRTLGWPLLWLELVPVETPRWQAFVRAASEAGAKCDVHKRYEIGVVDIRGDCETYESKRSKNLRRNLRKDLQRLEEGGPVQLRVYAALGPEEVDRRIREAFEIEDRSWKGGPGHTVLRTPGMLDFYTRQARQLAEWGSLRVVFLERDGRPIAFEMGWVAKRIYHSFKVGFDDAFRDSGPGHLLRMLLVRHWFACGEVDRVDFQGPMTEALASWSTGSYPIGRIVVAPGGIVSRAAMRFYRAAVPIIRRLRRRGASAGQV